MHQLKEGDCTPHEMAAILGVASARQMTNAMWHLSDCGDIFIVGKRREGTRGTSARIYSLNRPRPTHRTFSSQPVEYAR